MSRKSIELHGHAITGLPAPAWPGLRRAMPAWLARWAALLAVACGLALVLSVGMDHPIQDDNEGLYGSVAREMLASHSWIVPTLDGVPYLEKPPMLYWITALAYSTFGVSEVATRAAPVLGLLLVFSAIAWFARREWGERTALLALAVAASSPLFLGMGRMLMFDLLFTGFYTWSLVALHEALVRDGGRRWMAASYVALALAVLTKGLAALVFIGLIGLALASSAPRGERRARFKRLFDPVAMGLFAAIAVPWHLLAWRAQPGFGWFYFVNEHVLRFLDRREPHDYYEGPLWYYLPRVFGALLPWSMLVFVRSPANGEDTATRRFLLLAFVVPLVFFSLSGGKANYYMVVVLPAAALLLARRIERLGPSRAVATVPLGWIALFGVGAVAGARLLAPAQWPHAGDAIVLSALGLAALALVLALLRRPVAATLASAAVAIPFALFLSDYLKANESMYSGRPMAMEIEARGLKRVYIYRDFEAMSALPFYLHRPIGIIDPDSNELAYGIRSHPDRERFPTVAKFLAMGPQADEAIVVADSRNRDFQATPLARRLAPVARSGKLTLYVWASDSSRLRTRATQEKGRHVAGPPRTAGVYRKL